MKSPVTKFRINWLTSSDHPPLEADPGWPDIVKTPIPMSPDVGSGWVELYPLAMGMNIARGFHGFNPRMTGQLVPFIDVKGEVSEPTLVVSATRTGRVILRERRVGADFIFDHNNSLFEHVDVLDYLPVLDASRTIEVTMLKLGDSMLRTLLGEDVAQGMLEKLQVSDVPSASVFAVPTHISALMHATLTTHLTGTMRKLHAQAKALEYICALAQHAGSIPERLGTSPRKQLMTQLREELVNLEGKVPTLDALARQYGISARTMNDDFKNCFGYSIYAYVSESRLSAAQEALLTTNLPMKTIAANFGYSHVNHFITAFKRKFGYSPGSIRKKNLH